MAGYMRKLNGYVYDGVHTAGEAMPNGVFVSITSGGVKKITAAGDTTFRVQEKTTLWGAPALVLDVIEEGDSEIYFLENEFDTAALNVFDEAAGQCAIGDYCKMHRPVINDELIMTVDGTLYASLAVGDTVKPASGGSVAKVTE